MEQDVQEKDKLLLRFKYNVFFDLNPKVRPRRNSWLKGRAELEPCFCVAVRRRADNAAVWTGPLVHPAGGDRLHRGGDADVRLTAGEAPVRGIEVTLNDFTYTHSLELVEDMMLLISYNDVCPEYWNKFFNMRYMNIWLTPGGVITVPCR